MLDLKKVIYRAPRLTLTSEVRWSRIPKRSVLANYRSYSSTVAQKVEIKHDSIKANEVGIDRQLIRRIGSTPYIPKFSDLVYIKVGQDLSSKLYSKKAYKVGETVALLKDLYLQDRKDYTTVQVGKDLHVSLMSEFVFSNHSCNPSLNFHIVPNAANEYNIEIVANKDIEVDDEFTFFYPSTEWVMDQPFKCWCKTEQCIEEVKGAKFLNGTFQKAILKGSTNYYFNRHILDLLNN